MNKITDNYQSTPNSSLPPTTALNTVFPLVLSASRANDIPAFHAHWFFEQWKQGYTLWTNPFNTHQKQIVRFKNVRAIVFWSKNPAPIIPYLSQLDDAGVQYYFNFTLNNYEGLSIERNVPPLHSRIETFMQLSNKLGSNRVRWRFDPLMKTEQLSVDQLLQRLISLGNILVHHTNRLIFSFIIIEQYKRVKQQLITSQLFNQQTIQHAEFTEIEKLQIIQSFQKQLLKWQKQNPLFEIASCAESVDYSNFGIIANSCVDPQLIASLCPNDNELLQQLGYEINLWGELQANSRKIPKHVGQRKHCHCSPSKDIGRYGSCKHQCIYCYAGQTV